MAATPQRLTGSLVGTGCLLGRKKLSFRVNAGRARCRHPQFQHLPQPAPFLGKVSSTTAKQQWTGPGHSPSGSDLKPPRHSSKRPHSSSRCLQGSRAWGNHHCVPHTDRALRSCLHLSIRFIQPTSKSFRDRSAYTCQQCHLQLATKYTVCPACTILMHAQAPSTAVSISISDLRQSSHPRHLPLPTLGVIT